MNRGAIPYDGMLMNEYVYLLEYNYFLDVIEKMPYFIEQVYTICHLYNLKCGQKIKKGKEFLIGLARTFGLDSLILYDKQQL
jgi:hypothetical protein